MKRALGVSLLSLVVGACPAAPAARTSTGAVRTVAANSLTIKGASGRDMTFAVDANTHLIARGAGTKAAAGGGRLMMTDSVKTGDRVSITYRDMGSTMH